MTIQELVDLIDDDTKLLATVAFEPIDVKVLAKRLKYRVDTNRYKLHRDGRVYLLKKVPNKQGDTKKAA